MHIFTYIYACKSIYVYVRIQVFVYIDIQICEHANMLAYDIDKQPETLL